MKTIWVGEMLAEMNSPNCVFSVRYRKDNGTVGEKKNVMLRKTTNELNDRRRYNRSGLISILVPTSGEEREITIDLIFEFNGMRVIRPPYIK